VFRGGRAWSNNLLVLRSLASDLPHNRIGFITSKRVGGAVVRNRVRRRLREALRLMPLGTSWDIVVSAKLPPRGGLSRIETAVIDLLARAGILKEAPGGAA
jgi:ribonuclease P protein component